jgi:tripeptidyl-peptidase-1
MYSKPALLAAFLSQALPAFGVVQEQLTALPSGWTEAAVADESSTISLSIGLAQQNLDQLEPKLLAVSTPGNAEYGQHLDYDDVLNLFAPTAEANSSVVSWLTSAGVSKISSDGHWVNFATTVGTANKLLNTTFKTYENSGTTKLRTTQYSVPDDLASYIDLISPTTYFGKTVASMPRYTKVKREDNKPIRRSRVMRDDTPTKRSVDASCQTSITPTCIKELYSVGDYTPKVSSGSRVGFGSFLNQSALYADLFDFEDYYKIPSQNFSVTLINGGTNDQAVATAQVGEADLDVQNIIGVSHPMYVVSFSSSHSSTTSPELCFFRSIQSTY